MPGDFRFGERIARPSRLILESDAEVVHVKPKTMEVLLALAERPGEVLGRDELLEIVWQDTCVSDDVLTQAIAELRRALRDEFRQPLFIETIPRRGYRLIPPVVPLVSDRASSEPPEVHTVARRPAESWSTFRAGALISLAVVVIGLTAWIGLRLRAEPPHGPESPTLDMRADGRPTHDTEAYELYLKARQKFRPYRPTDESLDDPLRLARQAVLRDARFAEAYALIAEIQTSNGFWNTGPRDEMLREARDAARAALAIDPDMAYPHAVSGLATAVLDWKWEDGYREAARALEIDPNDGRSLTLLAMLLLARGRPDEAVRHAYRAYELAPIDSHALGGLSWVLYQARRHDEAVEFMARTLDADPDATFARNFRPVALAHAGRFDEALAAERNRWPEDPDRPTENLGVIFVLSGREQEARSLLAKAPPEALAQTRARLGDKEALLRRVEELAREHMTSYVMWLRTDPAWDPIRNEPRFEQVLVKVGLVG